MLARISLALLLFFLLKVTKKRRRIYEKMHCIGISFWKFVKKDVVGADGRCSYIAKKCSRRRRRRDR